MSQKVKKENDMLVCGIVFAICLIARVVEYFVLHTDETILAENIIHKVLGIVVLVISLKLLSIHWEEIGFLREKILSNLAGGILLGTICFAVAYMVECFIAIFQNGNVHFELYISGFSLSGELIKQTGILFILLCAAFNIINVIMEEGIFRGMFIRVLSEKRSFWKANIIAALFFGIWHWVMPIRDYLYGDSSIGNLLIMAIGYLILSALMGLKWGMLYKLTGSLWMGIGDHYFNNFVVTNLLHVVSNGQADNLQIVRILLAQILSFIVVCVIFKKKRSIEEDF